MTEVEGEDNLAPQAARTEVGQTPTQRTAPLAAASAENQPTQMEAIVRGEAEEEGEVPAGMEEALSGEAEEAWLPVARV